MALTPSIAAPLTAAGNTTTTTGKKRRTTKRKRSTVSNTAGESDGVAAATTESSRERHAADDATEGTLARSSAAHSSGVTISEHVHGHARPTMVQKVTVVDEE